jgi:predicted metalloprotease with PDZ domain
MEAGYNDKPNEYEEARSVAFSRGLAGENVQYALGLKLDAQGTIGDVRVGSPADAAKLAPGEKIMAVNGQAYSGDAIKDAVRAAKTGGPMN